jgi:hypothetical protein
MPPLTQSIIDKIFQSQERVPHLKRHLKKDRKIKIARTDRKVLLARESWPENKISIAQKTPPSSKVIKMNDDAAIENEE